MYLSTSLAQPCPPILYHLYHDSLPPPSFSPPLPPPRALLTKHIHCHHLRPNPNLLPHLRLLPSHPRLPRASLLTLPKTPPRYISAKTSNCAIEGATATEIVEVWRVEGGFGGWSTVERGGGLGCWAIGCQGLEREGDGTVVDA